MINAKLVPASIHTTFLTLALFYGGIAQILAGMWEFKKSNTFGATAFTSYGAFWLALASIIVFEELNLINFGPDRNIAIGLFLVAWTVFTFYMWIGSLKINNALVFVLTTLLITYILLDLAEFSQKKLEGGTMSDLKRGLTYFLSVLAYGVILLIGIKVYTFLQITGERTYNIKPAVEFFFFFTIAFGLLLALPELIVNFKKEGIWKIDRVKIISIALPAFVPSLLRYLYFCTNAGFYMPFGFLFVNYALSSGVFFFAGVVSGYFLLSSVHKEET